MESSFTAYHFTTFTVYVCGPQCVKKEWITLKEVFNSFYLNQTPTPNLHYRELFLKAPPATGMIYYTMIYEHELIFIYPPERIHVSATHLSTGDRALRSHELFRFLLRLVEK